MKITLLNDEIALLEKINIKFIPDYDYDDDTAFELLESVYTQEVFYAQEVSKSSQELANAYADLADKIQRSIY